MSAGRTCPISYRYGPGVFRQPAAVATDVLYVVGGLYGNTAALATVLEMFAAESGNKHLIFNGDFNWFNVDDDDFLQVNDTVLAFDAIRGNVETEISPGADNAIDAGCGCGYPDWVDDTVVAYSNTIIKRLAITAARFPHIQQALAALPMFKRIDVGGVPVGIVHGDAESLAGWGFGGETLADTAARHRARQWFDDAGVQIFASSHTCSPIFMTLANSSAERCLIANNGAAGMPNFIGRADGLLTRIAVKPGSKPNCKALYATQLDGVVVEALPICYDARQAQASFLRQWPPGSAAHEAYWQRLLSGPMLGVEQADKTAG